MPLKGFKDIKTFQEKKKEGEATKSANPTKIGTLDRKDGTKKKWVLKELKSRSEVLVECVTGEIYRYLIGGRQPKIRVAGPLKVLSEFIPYRAVRDILDVPEHRLKALKFKQQFCVHIDGFMRVLFSSIFMEENDLSDQNYGLAIVGSSEGKTEEIHDEEFGDLVNITESPFEDYGDFIKIDHGQSFNSIRIARAHKPLSIAEIKFFPPPYDFEIDSEGLDIRNKKDRETFWFTRRKYVIEPYFIDRIILHFLSGVIDGNYILNLNYQPSTLPVYDGRLLTILDGIPEKQQPDVCERGKYRAIAKIVFTDNNVYLGLSTYAAHLEFPDMLSTIMKKIFENKELLFKAIRVDIDFCAFCYREYADIQNDMRNSMKRMTHKSSDPEEESERYGEFALTDPVDIKTLNAMQIVGKHFCAVGLEEHVEELIQKIQQTILAHPWRVKGTGGEAVRLSKAVTKVFPHIAAEMLRTLKKHIMSPQYRRYRTMRDLIFLSCLAEKKSSFWRAKETQQGYDKIAKLIATLGQFYPAVQYLIEKFKKKDADWALDYYELSKEIDEYVKKKGGSKLQRRNSSIF